MESEENSSASDPRTALEEPQNNATSEAENESSECYSCMEKFPFNVMYRCKSCPVNSEAESDKMMASSNEIFYCRLCIVGPHLRRNHEIVDSKGYNPAVCDEHRNLCLYYCETCLCVFCSDCTKSHSLHKFQPLEEKAPEVRGKIFAYITSSEEQSKPLKHKEAVTQSCFKKKAAFRNSFERNKLTDTLCSNYEQEIRSKTKKWCETLKDVLHDDETQTVALFENLKSVNAESGESCVKLKELLQTSEGNLVKQFTDAEASLKFSAGDQKNELKMHIHMEWTEELHILIHNSINQALKSVKIPGIARVQMEELELDEAKNVPGIERQIECAKMDVISQAENELSGWYTDELFGLNVSQNQCSFFLLTETDEKPSVERIVLTDVNVKYVFFKIGYIAICTTMDSFKVYCPERNVFVYEFKVDKNCIPLQINSWEDNTFSSLAWFEDSLQVKFTPVSNGELTLAEKPRLLGQNVEIFSFTHSENKVTIWDRKKNLRMDISNLQHGLSSVDNMKVTDKKTLFLLDYRLHLAVKFHFDLGTEPPRKFSLEKVLKISPFSTDPLKLMTVICGKLLAFSNYEEVYSADIPT